MDIRNFDARVELQIVRHGWMVQGVFAVTEGEASWCYTIGVEDKGGPELCIIGLPPDFATVLLNRVVKRSLQLGVWPAHNDTLAQVLPEGFDLRVIQVGDEHVRDGDWFNVATHRRGGREGFQPLQLVWPDADGRFEATDHQPILV